MAREVKRKLPGSPPDEAYGDCDMGRRLGGIIFEYPHARRIWCWRRQRQTLKTQAADQAMKNTTAPPGGKENDSDGSECDKTRLPRYDRDGLNGNLSAVTVRRKSGRTE